MTHRNRTGRLEGNPLVEQRAMLDEHQAAEYLNCSVHWLRAQRTRGAPPPFCKLGKRLVRYSLADLQDFVAANRVEPRGEVCDVET